ncbi:MAG: DUF6171 family protein [Clostridiales bacterium]|nr:DUF6171 family protein [Clostridiales bacterium]
MEHLRDCRGCNLSVRVSPEDIEKMVDEIISSKNFNIISGEEYTKRLEQCKCCKYMEYDTTCSQCGCIVQIRALLKDKDCPYPSTSRWR